MLKIAHPWIKNRNVVQGSIVFSFGNDGVAEVKDVPGAREAIRVLLWKQRGYFIVDDKEKVAPADGILKTPITMEADGKVREVILEGAEPVSEPAQEEEAPMEASESKLSEEASEEPPASRSKKPVSKKPISKKDKE